MVLWFCPCESSPAWFTPFQSIDCRWPEKEWANALQQQKILLYFLIAWENPLRWAWTEGGSAAAVAWCGCGHELQEIWPSLGQLLQDLVLLEDNGCRPQEGRQWSLWTSGEGKTDKLPFHFSPTSPFSYPPFPPLHHILFPFFLLLSSPLLLPPLLSFSLLLSSTTPHPLPLSYLPLLPYSSSVISITYRVNHSFGHDNSLFF